MKIRIITLFSCLCLPLLLKGSEVSVREIPAKEQHESLCFQGPVGPIMVDNSWILYSGWVKTACSEKKAGTFENPLNIPLDLEQMFKWGLFLQYLKQDQLAEFKEKHLQGMSIDKLLSLSEKAQLLEIPELKDVMGDVLAEQVADRSFLNEFIKSTDFIKKLGLSDEQIKLLLPYVLKEADCEFLRNRLCWSLPVSGEVLHVMVSPLGEYLLVSGKAEGTGGFCDVWHIGKAENVCSFTMDKPIKEANFLVGAKVVMRSDREVVLCDLITMTKKQIFKADESDLRSLSISSDFKTIVIGTDDEIILSPLLQKMKWVVKSANGKHLFFASNNSLVVEVSDAGIIRFYAADTGELLTQESEHEGSVTDYYCFRNKILTVGSTDFCLWECPLGAKPYLCKKGKIRQGEQALVWAVLGKQISVDADQEVTFFDEETVFNTLPFSDQGDFSGSNEMTFSNRSMWNQKIHTIASNNKSGLLYVSNNRNSVVSANLNGMLQVSCRFNKQVEDYLSCLSCLDETLLIKALVSYAKKELGSIDFLKKPHMRALINSVDREFMELIVASFPELCFEFNEYQEGRSIKDYYTRVSLQDRNKLVQVKALTFLGHKVLRPGIDFDYMLARKHYEKALELIEDKEELGYREERIRNVILCGLGLTFFEKIGIEKDRLLAIDCFEKFISAVVDESGHCEKLYHELLSGACYYLTMLIGRDGPLKNLTSMTRYCRLIKKYSNSSYYLEHADISLSLSLWFQQDITEVDWKKAYDCLGKWLKKNRQEQEVEYSVNRATLKYNLGNMAYNGKGVKQSYSLARDYFEAALGEANVFKELKENSIYLLARIYRKGDSSLKRDYGKAQYYYEKVVSEANNSSYIHEALFRLGVIAYKGFGTQPNIHDAKKYLRQAKMLTHCKWSQNEARKLLSKITGSSK